MNKMEIVERDPKLATMGSLIISIPEVKYYELQQLLNFKFPDVNEKYSESVTVRFKRMDYRLYTLYKTPRIGSIDQERDLHGQEYMENAHKLKEELITLINNHYGKSIQ
jgi:hypothetical protein